MLELLPDLRSETTKIDLIQHQHLRAGEEDVQAKVSILLNTRATIAPTAAGRGRRMQNSTAF